jgi:hypothetical protein
MPDLWDGVTSDEITSEDGLFSIVTFTDVAPNGERIVITISRTTSARSMTRRRRAARSSSQTPERRLVVEDWLLAADAPDG